jgi:hypothetical protein
LKRGLEAAAAVVRTSGQRKIFAEKTFIYTEEKITKTQIKPWNSEEIYFVPHARDPLFRQWN